MKAKVIETGKIKGAKRFRFKDMTAKEKKSFGIDAACTGEELFYKHPRGCKIWAYIYDDETVEIYVEILEEDETNEVE